MWVQYINEISNMTFLSSHKLLEFAHRRFGECIMYTYVQKITILRKKSIVVFKIEIFTWTNDIMVLLNILAEYVPYYNGLLKNVFYRLITLYHF